MTVTQWLYRGWNMRLEIAELQRELSEARERATSTVSRLDSVNVSGTKDPHKFDRLAELSDTTQRLIERDNAIIAEIQDAIMNCQTYKLRHLLRLRFIDCLDWETIDNEMNYSSRHRVRLYKQAIEEATPFVEEKMSLKCPN